MTVRDAEGVLHHVDVQGSTLFEAAAAAVAAFRQQGWAGAALTPGAVRAGGVVLRRVNAARTQMGVAAILRRRVVGRYQEEPLSYFHSNPTGELLAHVQSDAEASSQVLGPLPYACGTVILVVISTVWMFATDWVLGMVALILFPAITALNVVYQRRTEGPAAHAQSLIGDVSNVVTVS